MNLELDEQQEMTFSAALRFFEREEVIQAARKLGARADSGLWRDAAEMGFVTMRAPAKQGGLEAGLIDAALVCEAAGRGIAPIPIADGIAACSLLGRIEGEAATALLKRAQSVPIGFDAQPDGIQLTLQDGTLLSLNGENAPVMIASGNQVRELFDAALIERTLLRTAWLVGASLRANRR